jgi:hypothetical protein
MSNAALGEWFAGLPWSSGSTLASRLGKVGGKLELVDDAVTFTPLARLGRRRTLRLAELEDRDAFADQPPRLRITPHRGKPLVLIVVPTRASTIRSTDTSARDAAIEAIRAAIRLATDST